MWLTLIPSILAIIQKFIPDFAAKTELEKELTQLASNVLTAEVKSESWLTRSWRPWMMFSLTNLVLLWGINNYIIRPYLMMWGIVLPDLHLPTELWTLIGLGFGVYGGARTLEKMLDMFLSRR